MVNFGSEVGIMRGNVQRNQQQNLANNFTNIFNLHEFEWKELGHGDSQSNSPGYEEGRLITEHLASVAIAHFTFVILNFESFSYNRPGFRHETRILSQQIQ